MIELNARYYDGESSAQHPVTVRFYEDGSVWIEGDALSVKTSLDSIKISSRLGNTPRSLFLASGAKLEIADNEAVDQINRYFNRGKLAAWLDRLEKNMAYVGLALVMTVALVWAGVEYGVPFAAQQAARQVPASVATTIADQTLATLDEWLMQPTRLSASHRQQLQHAYGAMFQPLTGTEIRLVFRDSPDIGANAFALPGNIIVVTDQLINLAENDRQIMAVLAHETGHVVYQHGLRSLFQNSVTAILLAITLGDLTSLNAISATLPTALLQSHYSRRFETEADRYAVAQLQKNHIKPAEFARILKLLHQQQNHVSKYDYLSSHPALAKRIQMIEQAQ